MSWDNIASIKKIKVTPNGQPITKSEKLLLFVLAEYYHEAIREAWVSLPRLAHCLPIRDERAGAWRLGGLGRRSLILGQL